MRLLLTVAHPDDESFGCGSVLLHAASRRWHATVVCATRGERGETTDPSIEPGSLGLHREAELRRAATILGVADVRLFDWKDSGVDGDPEPGTLADAPRDEVVAAIMHVVDDVEPDVVVTLDASDGHRDHDVVRDAAVTAVARAAWRTPRLYLWCLPFSLLDRFAPGAGLGTPDNQVTTVVDVRAHLDARWRAIRAHASQRSPYDDMAPDLQDAFLTTDRLRRLVPPWKGGPTEDDWMPPV